MMLSIFESFSISTEIHPASTGVFRWKPMQEQFGRAFVFRHICFDQSDNSNVFRFVLSKKSFQFIPSSESLVPLEIWQPDR